MGHSLQFLSSSQVLIGCDAYPYIKIISKLESSDLLSKQFSEMGNNVSP